ncbi:hypothetical protein DBR11_14930 [Pedobacter sp. HMWF019]|uniref:RagB/SusD family nutrient uptake outer membrane protein n=1 Tax=Pedobacter sp. HMWF019 TaxID=2056856 RepID=UPI000D370E25|nr:RagB/SusD family nutrient uptake outer membrane protein [Pedobacter sp. HMWF019]PTS98425.1 hypothetical protein DBR11_14930 [Pedobacter sp. HMWF019]
MKTIFKYLPLALVLFLCNISCKKGFLEAKPDKAILVPQTLDDLQALLDNLSVMNQTPFYQLVSSDDLQISDAGFLALPKSLRNAYTWQNNPFEGLDQVEDWVYPYRQVFYSNIVLDALETNQESQDLKNQIKGQALFFRAHAIYQLSQLFTKPYVSETASSTPGLIYPIVSDVNQRPERKTLEFTYQQMLTDLATASALLQPLAKVKSRPSRAAAYALTARIFLTMDNYNKADENAALALAINSDLIDYNTLTARLTSGTRPFPQVLPNGNSEVLFYTALPNNSFLTAAVSSPTVVNAELFSLYANDDLRKPIFYVQRSDGRITFKGSYSGAISGTTFFSGIATDELYLIRSECQARLGRTTTAMGWLNNLLIKRWKTGTFVPYNANTPAEALSTILRERRKELVTRGIRWSDLKRLNTNPATAVNLSRSISGSTFNLAPEDPRYVFPIPPQENIK